MVAEVFAEVSPEMIAATVFGVIGAAIATYWEIVNTSGPRERAFMVRACIWFGLAIFILSLACGLFPSRIIGFSFLLTLSAFDRRVVLQSAGSSNANGGIE